MADNLRKYTTQEVLNKVYTDSSGNSIGLNAATSKETLNAVLTSGSDSLNVALSGGTISGDVTISGDLTVSGGGSYAYSEVVIGDMTISDTTTSSSTKGGKLILSANDGAVMDAHHQLGMLDFAGATTAESTSGARDGTITSGARIRATTDTTWGGAEHGTNLDFFTSDGSTALASGDPMMRINALGMASIGTDNATSKVHIKNASGNGYAALFIDQDNTSNKALEIDSEQQSGNIFHINNPAITTGTALAIEEDTTLQTGRLVHLVSSSAHTGTRTLFNLSNTNTASVNATGMTIAQASPAKILFADHNIPATSVAASDATAIHIDFDRTVPNSGSAAHNDIGIDLDVNSASLGTSTVKGMDIDVVGATSGTSTATGLDISVSGADTNYGAIISHDAADGIAALQIINTNSSPTSFTWATTALQDDLANSQRYLHIIGKAASNYNLGWLAYQHKTANSAQDSMMSIGLYGVNDILNVTGHGRVGIGHVAPQESLDISGGNIRLDNDQHIGWATTDGNQGRVQIRGNESDDTILFRTDNATRMKIDASSRISLGNNDSGGDTTNTVFGNLAGNAIASGGINNTIFGSDAGNDITTGDKNTLIGYLAGDKLSTTSQNVVIGSAAGRGAGYADNVYIGYAVANSTSSNSSNNTLIGSGVATSGVMSGGNNTAVGKAALSAITSGANNVAIGVQALTAEDAGSNNTAIGTYALQTQDAGADAFNVGLGYAPGASLSTGIHNIAIGYAMTTHQTGSRNIAIGHTAMNDTNATAAADGGAGGSAGTLASSDNVFIGFLSGGGTWAGSDSQYNVAIGNNTLSGAMDGAAYNVAVGTDALNDITTGSFNTAIGKGALSTATTAAGNVFIGYDCGLSIPASQALSAVVAIGKDAFVGSGYTTTGAGGTIAIGDSSLKSLTTGGNNIAVGSSAGTTITTGASNIIMGYQSGGNVLDADNNILIGYQSGKYLGSHEADDNVFIGYKAGFSGETDNANGNTATDNVGIGSNVMAGNTGSATSNLFTAYSMVAIGKNAGYSLTTGKQSVFIGQGAGYAVTTGITNVFLGQDAGDGVTTGSTNVCIGYGADTDTNSRGGCIVIGSGLSLNTASDNVVEIGNNTNSMTYDLDGGDITVTSDVRTKKNIKGTKLGLEFINKLRPITYQTKPTSQYPKEFGIENPSKKSSNKTWDGLIAQEVKEVMDDMDVGFSGWEEGINTKQRLAYGKFVMPLIKAIQELSSKVEELEAKLSK